MVLISAAIAAQAMANQNEAFFKTDRMVIAVKGGFISKITSLDGRDYLASVQRAPLLSLRIKGTTVQPESMKWIARTGRIVLSYNQGKVRVEIVAVCKPTHISFELVKLTPKKDVDLAIWGPYPTTITKSIGETVGVVHDDEYAVGIQALNAKTLGGYPNTEDDVEPSYDIFASGNLVDVSGEDAMKDLYRGDTAKQTPFGSVLQAYTRDRSKQRIIENWGHKYYVAPPYRDGGLVGSKIALFGCPASEALPTIGKIEIAEGLPHPILDGAWAKVSPNATESYLIIGFGENDLDQAIALTKKAGLRYLYTDSCFETWGHFKLHSDRFPDGWTSMKRCVDRAKEQGIRLGVHTLSNFITTNDPYVTPVPDKRLAIVGSSKLASSLSASAKSILIDDPKFFNQMQNNTLRTVRVGDELIEYESVSTSAPWTLLNCKRGSFGTMATSHRKGSMISKLMDHGYRTFLTDADLTVEMSKSIANFFNETGLLQLSLDGLEGNWSTGMGQFGRTLMTKTWYDNLRSDLRGQVINDASNPGHFNWHIYTRMNWGEPWYAGFRESQTQYRLMNQRYYQRNLMPSMLGWFSMSAETSLEDAEWLLARAAGFDAGFCLCTSPQTVGANGDGEAILESIKEWEKARLAGAFSVSQKQRLRLLSNEFRLEPSGSGWRLIPVYSVKGRLPASGSISYPLHNRFVSQPLQLIVQVPAKTVVTSLSFAVADSKLSFTEPLVGPCAVRFDGQKATLLTPQWKVVRSIPFKGSVSVPKGGEMVNVSGSVLGDAPSETKLEFRLVGPSEEILPSQ